MKYYKTSAAKSKYKAQLVFITVSDYPSNELKRGYSAKLVSSGMWQGLRAAGCHVWAGKGPTVWVYLCVCADFSLICGPNGSRQAARTKFNSAAEAWATWAWWQLSEERKKGKKKKSRRGSGEGEEAEEARSWQQYCCLWSFPAWTIKQGKDMVTI